jgi:hypothetical protein
LFVLNRCGGEKKVIAACYTLLVEALAALKPDLMSRVSVLMQSEAILKALSPIPLTRTPEPQTLNPKP